MPPVRHEITIDGLRLSFLEQGTAAPGKPSVVMLHGLMGCADTFRPLLEELPQSQHVIVLDLPGAGGSERRRGLDATLPAMARITRRVIEELGLDRPMLLGHSHGGSVAMMVAQSWPEHIGPLVLVAPAHPYFDEGDPLIRFYLSLPGRLFAYTLPWYPRWMQMIGLRRMAGPQSWDNPSRLIPYRENLRTPGTVSHLLELLRTWQDDMGQLRRQLRKGVAHPALIIWGDSDRAVPVHSAAELREHFALSELKVLEGVGHRPAEERAFHVGRLVSEFASRMTTWGWRYTPEAALKPNRPATQPRTAALMTPSFDSGD